MTTAAVRTAEEVHGYGLLSERFGGVQIDISTVLRDKGDDVVQTYLCDHNCTTHVRGEPTGGEYNCPAAFTLNRGGVRLGVPPGADIVEGVRRAATALAAERDRYLAEDLPGHAARFRLPDWLCETAVRSWDRNDLEVALFGGSPETHPDILEMVPALTEEGHAVHITMTGRRLMRDQGFAERLAAAGAEVLAVSADDVGDANEMRRLLGLGLDEVRAEWRSVPRRHGQLQKVYEAVYSCRVLSRLGCRVLVNIAVHDRNLRGIGAFLDAWTEALPDVWLNPFPVQSAFDDDLDDGVRRLDLLQSFVDTMIRRHHDRVRDRAPGWRVVARMHYWLMLRAAFDVHLESPRALAAAVGGDGFWRCYTAPGAGRYLQIAGGAGEPARQEVSGGRPGCFWNPSITAEPGLRVWDARPGRLHQYIADRGALAAASGHPCAGCGFPRLVGDSLSAESGMDEALRARYLALRATELGY